jgi:hypothetical protein
MSQTRSQSMFEAVMNILVGFIINLVLNFTVFPLFGWHITLAQNIGLGAIYTIVSLLRSYCLRRYFNRRHEAANDGYGIGV